MKYKLLIFCFVSIIMAQFFGYFYFVQESIGSRDYGVDEYDAYNMKLKFSRASKLKGENKRIIINSGSNSNFGLNSELLERLTSYNVINLGNNAANRLDYLYYGILQTAKKGDIIIMPLEFRYYANNGNYTDYHIKTLLRGNDSYFFNHSLIDRIKVISNIPIKQFAYKRNRGAKINREIELSELERNIRGKWLGYTYKSLTKTYDMNVGIGTTNKILNTYKYADYKVPNISDYFLETTNDFIKRMKEKKINVFFTFPSTIHSNRSTYNTQEKLKSTMLKNGFSFICEPKDFAYNINYFFNSNYHLNKEGAQKRTKDMAECLKDEGVI